GSPRRTRRAPSGTASTSLAISGRSIMEASSTTTTSNGSGLSAWWRKLGLSGRVPSRRCRVVPAVGRWAHRAGSMPASVSALTALRTLSAMRSAARGGGGGLQRLGGQQHQHAGDGGGLAGAGAAGDQQQVVVQGCGGSLGLQVFAAGGIGEELGEELREVRGHLGALPFGGFSRSSRLRGDAADATQAFGQAALVLAVAAQVHQAVFEHER